MQSWEHWFNCWFWKHSKLRHLCDEGNTKPCEEWSVAIMSYLMKGFAVISCVDTFRLVFCLRASKCFNLREFDNYEIMKKLTSLLFFISRSQEKKNSSSLKGYWGKKWKKKPWKKLKKWTARLACHPGLVCPHLACNLGLARAHNEVQRCA